MKNRSFLSLLTALVGFLFIGCGGDPNVEGAKLNINNKEWDKALANLDKAIATNPANAEAWKYKGLVYYQMSIDKRDNAVRMDGFTKMAAAFSKAVANGTPKKDIEQFVKGAWGSQVNRSISHMRRNEADSTAAAVDILKNAVSILPDSSITYALLGRALYLQKTDNPDAIQPLQMAIDKGYKEQAFVFDILARTLINNNRAAEAVPVLEKGQVAFPQESDKFEAVKIEAWKLSGQVDKALAAYSENVNKDQFDVDARLRYGNLLLQTGNFEQATVQLEKAYELNPSNNDVLYNLGIAYYNKAVGLSNERSKPETTNQRAQELKREMDVLFNKAYPFLEKAREINTTEGRDGENRPICKALFGIYANIGMRDKANALMECAGM